MNSEYVRLSGAERYYGKKNFLQSELSLLNVLKRQKEYQRLRKEEIALKIQLKKSIDDTQDALKILDAVMPKLVINHRDKNASKEELRELEAEEVVIEREIDNIKKRLSQLG